MCIGWNLQHTINIQSKDIYIHNKSLNKSVTNKILEIYTEEQKELSGIKYYMIKKYIWTVLYL